MPQQFPEAFLKKVRRVGKALNALAVLSPTVAGRLAFRIFCTPRRLPLRDEDQSFLSTARHSDIFPERGLRVRVYTWPAERDDALGILFLHGWESNSGRWRKYVKQLHGAGYTVHALDAPASGQSGGRRLNVLLYSRAVRHFIVEKGRPYAVVGHSLGGAAAVMSTTLLGAPRPEKMVLLGVFAESTRVIRDFGAILGVNDAVLNHIHREIERRSGLPIEAYSVTKKAAELGDVSGLVLHDRNDDVAPVEEGRSVAASWKVPFVETQGLGHRMQDGEVVQTVLRFIQG